MVPGGFTVAKASYENKFSSTGGAFFKVYFCLDTKKAQCKCIGLYRYLVPGGVLLSHGISHTTIGANTFHFWVRDGIRWYHVAIAARRIWFNNLEKADKFVRLLKRRHSNSVSRYSFSAAYNKTTWVLYG